MKDPVKQFKKLLILCWSTLTFYLIIKSFKPDMFVIVCNNKTLIRFGEMYAKFVDAWFNDIDGKENKTFDYFMK